MSENISSSILIVDDDPRFREIISAPFLVCGYNVIEARSAYEATAAINKNRIALAIVDFRLPEVDGVTWITQIREQGSRVPVVFVSANACDAKTFNRLRNILKVSLVLQKPIVPELLLDQLDSLLPPRPAEKPNTIDSSQCQDDNELQQNESLPPQDPQSNKNNDTVIERSGITQESTAKPIDHRQQVQNAIKLAKQQYFKQLPDEWLTLTDLVNQFLHDNNDESLRQAALEEAHKLGGTAGSLGFSDVGSAARRIEELLKLLNASEPAHYELLSNEISRLLVHGANSIVMEDEGTVAIQVSATSKANSKILLFAQAKTIDEATVSYCRQVDCELHREDPSADAFSRAKKLLLDGVVVDLTSEDYLKSLLFCRQLRETVVDNNLPLACLVSQNQPIDESDLLYAGFSHALSTPVEKNDLLKTICQLLANRQSAKLRVLVIDDDHVLCNFIASVLSVEGFLVQTLTDPIEVISRVETFRPDLILLDVMMPGISGYDICRLLKGTDQWRNLPVLYLTSKNTPEARAIAFKAGGDDFLSKPVITEELLARTNLHLDKALMLRETHDYDALTGCLQRQVFYKKLYTLLTDSETRDAGGSVSLFEINRFDELIKEHGISAAEIVLANLGQLLRTRFPSEALRARIGEKALALFLPKADVQVTEAAIELLLQEFSSLSFHNHKGEAFKPNFSSSAVNFPDTAQDIESIVALAYQGLVGSREQSMGLLGGHKK